MNTSPRRAPNNLCAAHFRIIKSLITVTVQFRAVIVLALTLERDLGFRSHYSGPLRMIANIIVIRAIHDDQAAAVTFRSTLKNKKKLHAPLRAIGKCIAVDDGYFSVLFPS